MLVSVSEPIFCSKDNATPPWAVCEKGSGSPYRLRGFGAMGGPNCGIVPGAGYTVGTPEPRSMSSVKMIVVASLGAYLSLPRTVPFSKRSTSSPLKRFLP